MFDDKLGIDHCLKGKKKKEKREKKNVVGIDHPNSWQASRKASVWRDEKIRERKKEAIFFFFFWESGPGSQAILRPKKKKKKEKLQRIPRYKRSYILGNGLKPNLQLIAGFRMSGKKMGNWVTKKEAIDVKKGQKIKKEALNLQRVERKE